MANICSRSSCLLSAKESFDPEWKHLQRLSPVQVVALAPDALRRALAAFEGVRARLREQMQSAETTSKNTRWLHRSLASATDEIGQMLQALRHADPAGMTDGLGQLT